MRDKVERWLPGAARRRGWESSNGHRVSVFQDEGGSAENGQGQLQDSVEDLDATGLRAYERPRRYIHNLCILL